MYKKYFFVCEPPGNSGKLREIAGSEVMVDLAEFWTLSNKELFISESDIDTFIESNLTCQLRFRR